MGEFKINKHEADWSKKPWKCLERKVLETSLPIHFRHRMTQVYSILAEKHQLSEELLRWDTAESRCLAPSTRTIFYFICLVKVSITEDENFLILYLMTVTTRILSGKEVYVKISVLPLIEWARRHAKGWCEPAIYPGNGCWEAWTMFFTSCWRGKQKP